MKSWPIFLPLVLGVAVGQGTFSYGGDTKDQIQIVGVCSVSADEVKCWEPTGKPSEFATDLAKKQLEESQYPMRIKYKKVNRLVIVRHQSPAAGSTARFNGEMLNAKGERVDEANAVAGTNGTPVYKMYWYHAEPGEKTFDLTAIVGTQVGQAPLQPKEGASTKVGPYTVKIEKVEEGQESNIRLPNAKGPMKNWKFSYVVEKDEKAEMPSFQVTALDGNKMGISRVDAEGVPVFRGSPEADKVPALVAGYRGGPTTGNRSYWVGHVRPDKISEFTIGGFVREKVVFKGIALEPDK